ncbi:MAG TPA: FadR/GntR family transcriptional regulator [Aurantimonas sp.]
MKFILKPPCARFAARSSCCCEVYWLTFSRKWYSYGLILSTNENVMQDIDVRRGSAEQALDELRELLRADGLGPGARLPTERALAERLAVNRATLRKALARLEMEGAIVRQVGRGTFVADALSTAGSVTAGASPIELMDARLVLEPAIAREAALRARKEDLERLELCLVRSETADTFEAFEEWDIAFHRALAEATQNAVFMMVMEMMRTMRSTAEWERLKRASFSPALRDRYRVEHRAIFVALESRDPVAAATATARHMQTVCSAISGQKWERGDVLSAPRSSAAGYPPKRATLR